MGERVVTETAKVDEVGGKEVLGEVVLQLESVAEKRVNQLLQCRDQISQITEVIRTKVQQRLHVLRRLRTFGVTQEAQLLFYHAVVESLLHYWISAWFGNLTFQAKAQIHRIVQTAMKIMGVRQHPSLQDIFQP